MGAKHSNDGVEERELRGQIEHARDRIRALTDEQDDLYEEVKELHDAIDGLEGEKVSEYRRLESAMRELEALLGGK